MAQRSGACKHAVNQEDASPCVNPVRLTPTAMDAPVAPRTVAPAPGITTPAKAPKPDRIPLQLRLPRDKVRAIKIAAAQREQTLSDFMLACFHAFLEFGRGHRPGLI
jgi:hypothetical protein